METVQGLLPAINEHPTVLTIGAFDGVHLGHQHLIAATVQRARGLAYQSAVLTFDPHPDLVLHPTRERLYLADLETRCAQIEALGVDLLIVLPFTHEVAALGARHFMERICAAVALRELWVGGDFALGRRREGDLRRLREIGQAFGYGTHVVEALVGAGTTISSTRIRMLLRAGEVGGIPPLLGRPFMVRGKISEGDRRGRTIGFPTANVLVDEHCMLPSDGVYVCHAHLCGEQYGAVTNVGVRPTFSGTQRTVEAYLLDFVGDVYGETLQVEFLARLRGEQRFDGVAALVAQIGRDVVEARAWLQQHTFEGSF